MSAVARQLWERGLEAFPDFSLEVETFTRHVERLGGEPPAVAHAADLFLACACAQGSTAALTHFERVLMPAAADAVRRVNRSTDFVDDVMQQVRTRLFVSTAGAPARIAEYGGRGTLVSWLRSVATRTALNAVESGAARARTATGPSTSLAGGPATLELELLKKQYGPTFAAALRAALESLSERDRTVFRMHYLEGLTVTGIAEVLKVERSTVTRWMTRAREALRTFMVEQLKTRLELRTGDVASLARALQRQVDVSLGALLREATG